MPSYRLLRCCLLWMMRRSECTAIMTLSTMSLSFCCGTQHLSIGKCALNRTTSRCRRRPMAVNFTKPNESTSNG